MAKFDFNRSKYAKLFDSKDGVKLLKTIVNSNELLHTNYGWYKTQGHKAPTSIPTPPKGLASFTVAARSLEAAQLMNMRAPLAGSTQEDTKGAQFYTASIPDFITPAWVETAHERDYRIKQYEQFGNDAALIADYVNTVQRKLDSMDATMNFMVARLMSTGKIDYRGIAQGIQAPIHKVPIPEENFVNAGAKVWTDPDAAILSYMAKIEDDFRNKWGYTGAMVWQMPRDMFYKVFLPSKEVRELVKDFRKLNYIASTEEMLTTEAMFRQAFVDYQGVSPIEVVTEKERNNTGATDTFIHGWDENVAVLRPVGDAVEFEYTDILDRYMYDRYGNGDSKKVFASVNNGLGLIVNSEDKDGDFLKWSTVGMMSAVPALVNFPHHVIVNTQVAD